MDPNFVEVKTNISADLHPSTLRDVTGSFQSILDGLVLTYRDQLKGIVLAYHNERILNKTASVHTFFPYFHVDAETTLSVLRLEKDKHLVGRINKLAPDYIGMLVLGAFNAVVYKDQLQGKFQFEKQGGVWAQCSDPTCRLKAGSMVKFAIQRVEASSSRFIIIGTMLPGSCSAYEPPPGAAAATLPPHGLNFQGGSAAVSTNTTSPLHLRIQPLEVAEADAAGASVVAPAAAAGGRLQAAAGGDGRKTLNKKVNSAREGGGGDVEAVAEGAGGKKRKKKKGEKKFIPVSEAGEDAVGAPAQLAGGGLGTDANTARGATGDGDAEGGAGPGDDEAGAHAAEEDEAEGADAGEHKIKRKKKKKRKSRGGTVEEVPAELGGNEDEAGQGGGGGDADAVDAIADGEAAAGDRAVSEDAGAGAAKAGIEAEGARKGKKKRSRKSDGKVLEGGLAGDGANAAARAGVEEVANGVASDTFAAAEGGLAAEGAGSAPIPAEDSGKKRKKRRTSGSAGGAGGGGPEEAVVANGHATTKKQKKNRKSKVHDS